MIKTRKTAKFPENLEVKGRVVAAGINQADLARAIGVSREVVSSTLNGHYKGINIIPAIKRELEKVNAISHDTTGTRGRHRGSGK